MTKNFKCPCFEDDFSKLDALVSVGVSDLVDFFQNKELCVVAAQFFADQFYAKLCRSILIARNARDGKEIEPSPTQYAEYMAERDLKSAIQHVTFLTQEVEGRA